MSKKKKKGKKERKKEKKKKVPRNVVASALLDVAAPGPAAEAAEFAPLVAAGEAGAAAPLTAAIPLAVANEEGVDGSADGGGGLPAFAKGKPSSRSTTRVARNKSMIANKKSTANIKASMFSEAEAVTTQRTQIRPEPDESLLKSIVRRWTKESSISDANTARERAERSHP